MSLPWHERVLGASMPTTIYHATTPRKLARYIATGAILPPVRGFDTQAAAIEWGRLHGRSIILAVPVSVAWPLPDHHLAEGLAWWSAAQAASWETT